MRVRTAIVALVAAVVAPPVAAQGEASFTGPRIEAHAGYEKLRVRPATVPQDAFDGRFDDSSIVYGAGVGYDLAVGRSLVAGVEANIDFSGAKEQVSTVGLPCLPPCAPQPLVTTLEAGRELDVSARVGFQVVPSGLLYAKGGYANARLEVTSQTGALVERIKGTADGYRLGVGYEHSFRGLFAKLEYRYSNFEGGLSRNQGLAGVGFRF